jgi:hypothetical protein
VKPIRFSKHASGYTATRGFTVAEVEAAIRTCPWTKAEQRALVAELETARALVEANRELAARFEQKLQTKLFEIWGAPA